MALLRRIAASLWTTLAAVILISAAAIALAVQAFGLRVSGGIALYFVIWWIGLFAVLPFGVRSQAEEGDVAAGTEPGAPTLPALREKALWTTLLAAIVLIAAAALMPLSGL
jgi:predicted secreted protein